MAKMGRPSKDTKPVTLRLEVKTLQAIDDARKEEDDLPTRPEMVRRIIAGWLEARERKG